MPSVLRDGAQGTLTRISVPGRWCLVAAGCVWVGALGVLWLVAAVVMAIVVHGVVRRSIGPSAVLIGLTVAGLVSGSFASYRAGASLPPDLPHGPVEVVARVAEDPVGARGGIAVAVPLVVDGSRWSGPRIGIGPLPSGTDAGDTVTVRGTIRDSPRALGNDRVAGILRVTEVRSVSASRNPLFMIGNGVRSRVRTAFEGGTSSEGLVVGLLIGDTEGIRENDLEDLRRSGLTHFVAVSGSNVALFLMAWWIVGMPLAIHPRLRVLWGLLGIGVFIVATRWEPSVVRASVMAGTMLIGGLVGLPLDPWMALGATVCVVLLVAGDLGAAIGFQLSVLATLGVMIGVGYVTGRRPKWLWVPLGATIGAQAAVAPLLLTVFGTVPLLAPIANVVATPIVSFTTIVALVGTIVPLPGLAIPAVWGARVVLAIAEAASGGPQLGVIGTVAAAGVSALIAWRASRPIGIAVALLIALGASSGSPPWPNVPSVVVMDVGQGDSILIQAPGGGAALIDGGRDVRTLDRALRRNGVARLDLLVVTHGDADHAAGLTEIVEVMDIGMVWFPAHAEIDGPMADIRSDADERNVPWRQVGAGVEATLGSMRLEVLGPSRRFQSDNDGSVVLLVTGIRSMLLAGDVEAVGQRALPVVTPDVLLVPHHGSRTTDLSWLADTVGGLAVLSYGENTYGHPHPEVTGLLRDIGVDVATTAEVGDVVIRLG